MHAPTLPRVEAAEAALEAWNRLPLPGFEPHAPTDGRLGYDGRVGSFGSSLRNGRAELLDPDREQGGEIKKVSYTHDAMIDVLIKEPTITQRALAANFGYTESWVSIIMASDAFKARLEARKEELVDPSIRTTIEERFRALAQKSLEVLQRKLEQPNVSDQLALQAASLAAKSLGLGVNNAQPQRPEPDRLERIGGRLLALLGDRAVQAQRSLDHEIVDVPSRPVSAPSHHSPSEVVRPLQGDAGERPGDV